jgi:hypothetical protein
MATLGSKIKWIYETSRSTSVFVPENNEPINVKDSSDKVIGQCHGDGLTQLKDLPFVREHKEATVTEAGLMSSQDKQKVNNAATEEWVKNINNETILSTTGVINDIYTSTGTIRFTGTAAVSVSGVSGGADGRDVLFINETAFDLTLMHQNAGSAAGNRLIIQGSDNVYIRPGGAARFRYSASESAWQMTDLWGSEYFPTLKGATTRTMQVTPTGYAQAEENIDLDVIDLAQTAALTKTDLNTKYPNHLAGQFVWCPNISTGGKGYKKVDGSNNEWVSFDTVLVV